MSIIRHFATLISTLTLAEENKEDACQTLSD
jgi:hypothetical protein